MKPARAIKKDPLAETLHECFIRVGLFTNCHYYECTCGTLGQVFEGPESYKEAQADFEVHLDLKLTENQ